MNGVELNEAVARGIAAALEELTPEVERDISTLVNPAARGEARRARAREHSMSVRLRNMTKKHASSRLSWQTAASLARSLPGSPQRLRFHCCAVESADSEPEEEPKPQRRRRPAPGYLKARRTPRRGAYEKGQFSTLRR